MAGDELVDEIATVRDADPSAFTRQARAEGERLKGAIEDGVFDNPQAIVGLEYEFYAVADDGLLDRTCDRGEGIAYRLMRVPRRLLEYIRFEKELGLHNAELSTSPLPLNADGISAQESEVLAQLRAAQQCVQSEGIRLVSDGMWTIPPQGESTREYLTSSVLDDGIRIASNMSASPRYHAMAHAPAAVRPAMRIDVPNVTVEADTVMPESLLTSIQPHYQIPRAADLPRVHRYALRIAAPLLALGVNSPLLPPDLYDDVPPDRILEEAWMSHRIPVFESVLNARNGGRGKVRFPDDLATVSDAIDRIVEDDVLVPMTPESSGRFDDRFATFRLKHGTYWRWVRPVFDGASRSAANARIEFRPLPAQPTIRDSIAFQAAFAGLLSALPRFDHPLESLSWQDAERNFYAAARDGLAADLVWITSDGDRTHDQDDLFRDLLAFAVKGLRINGFDDTDMDRVLGPLQRRIQYGETPASWKLTQVREALTEGVPFAEAVRRMQCEYLDRQVDSLFDDDFGAWIEVDRYRVGG